MHLLFVYGNAMRGLQDSHLLTDSLYIGTAKTVEKFSMNLTENGPYIFRSKNDDGNVYEIYGELYLCEKSNDNLHNKSRIHVKICEYGNIEETAEAVEETMEKASENDMYMVYTQISQDVTGQFPTFSGNYRDYAYEEYD